MTPETKDWFQLGVWVVGIVGGLVAAFKAIDESRRGRKQRAEELRWRRASAAREMLDAIHKHEYARFAVMMMDWHEGSHDYEVRKGQVERISYQLVLKALAKAPGAATTEIDLYICDCFDWLFYYIDRINHYANVGLILRDDFESSIAPYRAILNADWPTYQSFLRRHNYVLAERFFEIRTP